MWTADSRPAHVHRIDIRISLRFYKCHIPKIMYIGRAPYTFVYVNIYSFIVILQQTWANLYSSPDWTGFLCMCIKLDIPTYFEICMLSENIRSVSLLPSWQSSIFSFFLSCRCVNSRGILGNHPYTSFEVCTWTLFDLRGDFKGWKAGEILMRIDILIRDVVFYNHCMLSDGQKSLVNNLGLDG